MQKTAINSQVTLDSYLLIKSSGEKFVRYSNGAVKEISTLSPEEIQTKRELNRIIDKTFFGKEYKTFKGFDLISWSLVLASYNNEAIKKAEQLSKDYNVNVIVVKSDEEYYSDVALEKVISEKLYFVSEENWEKTGRTTEYLLRYERLKSKSLLDLANTKRLEKVNQSSTGLGEKIAEIKNRYRETHDGKDPNLSQIADILNENHIESPSGKTKWYAQTVKRILERSKIER